MTKYKFKTRPWPHQITGMKFCLRRMQAKGSAGLQVPMRWGKTKVAIDTATALHMKYGITRMLAVTTTSGLGVWEKEIPKHSPVPVIVRNYKGEVVYRSPVLQGSLYHPDDPVVTWLVVHHSVLFAQERDATRDPETGKLLSREWWPVPNPLIEGFAAEFMVVDESHKLGDAGSIQSKMAYRYGKAARFRMTLTGTAFHRGPLKVFGQMKFLDDSLFGTTVTGFKAQFVQFGGYGGYEIVGYHNLEIMAEKLNEALFIQEKPPMNQEPVVTTTPVELEEALPVYREMERESAIVVADKFVTAPIILTRHLRCQMIAGGWVKDEDGDYHRVGSEKLRALTDKLTTYREEGIEKIVIGCNFIPELKDVAHAATEAGYLFVTLHGGVPRGEERARRVERFQASERPIVFVAQCAAAAEAIDLSEASAMIFYSIPSSYVVYDQFKARIERYMDKRTLYYDHLLARGTRDEVSWFAMNLKMDVARFLTTQPDLVERITNKTAEDVVQCPITGN